MWVWGILGFVGLTMLLVEVVHFLEWGTLSVIALALTGGVVASLYLPEKKKSS